jgi:uncharacterized membrane protein SirB2
MSDDAPQSAVAARLDIALVFKRSAEVLVRDFVPVVVGCVALVVLPGALLRWIPGDGGGVSTLLTVLRSVLAMLYVALVSWGVVSRLRGRALRPGDFVREGLARATPGLQAALLAGAGIVLLLTVHLFARAGTLAGWMLNALLLTGALVGLCALLPLVPVAVVERLTPMAAFRRAAALTRYNRNRILGLALVLLLTLAPAGALAAGIAGPPGALTLALFDLLAWSLAATVPAVVYASLPSIEIP